MAPKSLQSAQSTPKEPEASANSSDDQQAGPSTSSARHGAADDMPYSASRRLQRHGVSVQQVCASGKWPRATVTAAAEGSTAGGLSSLSPSSSLASKYTLGAVQGLPIANQPRNTLCRNSPNQNPPPLLLQRLASGESENYFGDDSVITMALRDALAIDRQQQQQRPRIEPRLPDSGNMRHQPQRRRSAK